MALPGMTEAVADAILDWIDADGEPRLLGAEQDYYSSLDPPYAPRNGPLGSIEELLLVRDVTPAHLFGADLNRNSLIEPHEQQFTTIEGVDNSTGSLNRGWAAYLTLDSAERNMRPDGSPKIDVNMESLQDLHDQATEILGEEMANFIVIYRQGGPFEGDSATSRSASGVNLDFNLPGRVSLTNLLDLIGVNSQVAEQGQQGQQPTVVESPFTDDTSSMRDYLPKLFDNFAANAAQSIPGRININQAPRSIVVGIPGLELNVAEQIIYNRDVEFAVERPDRAYETWLLTEGLIDLEQMKRLMPLVCAGGDVYRAQVVGYFEEEGPAYRLEVTIDATQSPPVVRRRRELVELGPGYSPEVLGTTLDNGT
jgi:DNA uptake protein ComE-like DNA-binding protein